MARLFAFHAQAADIFHKWEECSSAKRIPSEERINGTGGKEYCPECKQLDDINGFVDPPRYQPSWSNE